MNKLYIVGRVALSSLAGFLLSLLVIVTAKGTSTETWTQYINSKPAATSVSSSDQFVVIQNGAVKRIPYNGMQNVVWGSFSSAAQAVFTDLEAGKQYAVSQNRTLAINETINVTTDTDLSTVPRLEVLQGGYFNISAGVTLTLPKNFVASLKSACFSATGTVAGLVVGSPQMFGAKGDNTNDDTTAIQKVVDAVRPQYGTWYAPNGTYKVTATINLSDGTRPMPNFTGESAKGVVFRPTMTGTTPLFFDNRLTMTFPNKPVMQNFTVWPATDYTGTAIKLSAACGDIFRNIHIYKSNYGVWLHDNSGVATWTETNVFEDFWVDYANSALRMEKGTGDGSFHGDVFNRWYINVGANQTAVDHVSGYYYNGRFDLFVWTFSSTSSIIKANGNAENNIGNITAEVMVGTSAIIQGSGRWWYTGSFNSQGGTLNDTTTFVNGESVFAANNYRHSTAMTAPNMSGGIAYPLTLNPRGIYNGSENYGLWKYILPGNVSILANGYFGSFITTNTVFNGKLEDAVLGWDMRLDGSYLHSFGVSGTEFNHGTNGPAFTLYNGKLFIGARSLGTAVIPVTQNPETIVAASPGTLGLGTNGILYLKATGYSTTGWKAVTTSEGTDAGTLNGHSSSTTPTANQIPVLASDGSFEIGKTKTFSKTISAASNGDILLGYNDYWSGTMTVTYVGTNRLSIKGFAFSLSSGHTPITTDYTKIKGYAPNTGALGVPYVKFLADGTTPHLYIPVQNAIAGGTLTVTFTSDIGHHPYFMPAAPAGTLAASATSLTGL